VLELSRPGNLRDIADLGLTLPEAKRILARVQQAVVAAQARDHAALRPECPSCGGRCRVKDWRPRQIATLFGAVTVRLPRFRCPGCGRGETGVSWPAHCRSTPELDQLQAQLSALMTYRVAAGVLAHLLPVAAGASHETLRSRTLAIGKRLRDAAAAEPAYASYRRA
jgi:transposase